MVQEQTETHRRACREAYSVVSATCPDVDAAFRSLREFVREKAEAIRNELIAALERAIKAEEEADALMYTVDNLRDENYRILDKCDELRTRVAELEAAMPSDGELYSIESVLGSDCIRHGHEAYVEEINVWLARLDAARKVTP